MGRGVVRWEGVITVLFGALLGLVLGVPLGWVVVASLAHEGLGTFSIPAAQLATWLVVEAAAGMVGAIDPARHACDCRYWRRSATSEASDQVSRSVSVTDWR